MLADQGGIIQSADIEKAKDGDEDLVGEIEEEERKWC